MTYAFVILIVNLLVIIKIIVQPSSQMSCILGSAIRKEVSSLRYAVEIWKISYSSPSYFIVSFGFVNNTGGAIDEASFVTPI